MIEFVPDLPKTLTGKIRRIELRQAEQERVSGGRGRTPDRIRSDDCSRALPMNLS